MRRRSSGEIVDADEANARLDHRQQCRGDGSDACSGCDHVNPETGYDARMTDVPAETTATK